MAKSLKDLEQKSWEYTPAHAIAHAVLMQSPASFGLYDPEVKDRDGRFLWVRIVQSQAGDNPIWDSCTIAETRDTPERDRISVGNRHGLANALANWMNDTPNTAEDIPPQCAHCQTTAWLHSVADAWICAPCAEAEIQRVEQYYAG